jgi:hypothetical protein
MQRLDAARCGQVRDRLDLAAGCALAEPVTSREEGRWCPMATFRTYAEVLGPDHPLMNNKARSTNWSPSRYRSAEIEQAMRTEPGVALSDVLRQTGGGYETTTRLTPKFRFRLSTFVRWIREPAYWSATGSMSVRLRVHGCAVG